MNTAEQVLDALAEAIANEDVEIRFGFSASVDLNGESTEDGTALRAFQEEKGVEYYPATRNGLIQALTFVGLKIEEGGE